MIFHVRAERKRQGIRLTTMAADLRQRYHLKIDHVGLSKRERGEIPYRAIELFCIRDYLDVPLETLVEMEEAPSHA